MASGSICAGGQESASSGAGGNALDTLTNPDLALLPAVDLVVHLHREERSGPDFADVALVLAVRERRLAEAEARIREADVDAAGLRDRIRALELMVANAEALARNSLGSDSSGFRGVASEDGHQSRAGIEPQIGAAELTGAEIRARDLTASETIVVPELPAGEIEDGEIMPAVVCFGAGVKATPAEVGDNMPNAVGLYRHNMPRPSPLTKIAGVLPAASSMPDQLADERAVEQVLVDDAVRSSHEAALATVAMDSREVSEAVAGKRKKEIAVAFVSQEKEEPLKKKLTPAGLKKKLKPAAAAAAAAATTPVEDVRIVIDQVAAWESGYDAVDAAQGTLQAGAAAAATPVEDVQTVIDQVTASESRYDVADAAQDTLQAGEEEAAAAAAATTTKTTTPVEDVQTVIHQVAAWESGYDAADAAHGTLQAREEAAAAAATTPVEDVQTVVEAPVARLQEQIIHEVPEIERHRVVPTGATKKAPRPKGVSFYNEFLKSEMEKRKLIKNYKENEETHKEQAAKAASNALYLRCFSQVPHLLALLRSRSAEEDSGEED